MKIKNNLFLNAAQKLNPKFCGVVLALGFSGVAFAVTTVEEGSNLTSKLQGATVAEHDFQLLGDVYMGSTFFMNGSSWKNISIDGAYSEGGEDLRAVIKRNGADVSFYVNSLGNVLSVKNSVITSATTVQAGVGAIHVTGANAILNLDGTSFVGNTSASGYAGALSIFASGTQVHGDVQFIDNSSTGDGAGAVYVSPNQSVVFEGETVFSGNNTAHYGGAVSVREGASATFKKDAVFDGNYATAYFGGAIDFWSGNSSVVFEENATFTNNYVKSSFVHAYGARGGAINIGYVAGSNSPQLIIHGTGSFSDNYVWGKGTTVGIGGALSLSVGGADPLGQGQIGPGFVYGAEIARGVFTDNYAYSENAGGYGGAIFAKGYNSTISLGDGSRFEGNAAKTLGGAIYFDQGTLNLSGDVTFSGNWQGATFDTSSGRPVHVEGTGSANAIYFAVSSNTATLNLANQTGEVISFADPIQSATGKIVTVNKTGMGKVIFTGHDSDILAQTTVSGGVFELGAGVAYGRLGTAATSKFDLSAGATLVGNAGAVLNATDIHLAGRVEVASGQFKLNGAGVKLESSTVLSLVIADANHYSSLDLGGQSLQLGGASLEIIADGYVPSFDKSDFFTIITSVAGVPEGQFGQGESIFINGAEFEILYGNGSVSLQQIGVIPEPSTYALFGGAGLLGLCLLRRRQRRAKEM